MAAILDLLDISNTETKTEATCWTSRTGKENASLFRKPFFLMQEPTEKPPLQNREGQTTYRSKSRAIYMYIDLISA